MVGPDQRSTAAHVIELADRFKYYSDVASPKSPRGKRRNAKRDQEQVIRSILRKEKGPVESALLKRRSLDGLTWASRSS